MKRLVVSIISLLAVLLTVSALEPKKVKFSCDLTTINKTENCHPRGPWTLTDVDGGWCIVRQDKYPDIPLGNKGLLIYKDCHTGRIWCYDIQCPMCDAQGVEHEIYMETNLVARCKRCYGAWQNIHQGTGNQTNYMGEYWLVSYKVVQKGNMLYISNW